MAHAQEPGTKLVEVKRVQGAGKLALGLGLLLLVYGADQGTKRLVEETMVLGQTIPVIDGLLWWRYYLNPGAAFSMGEGSTWIFTLISCLGALVASGLLLRARSLLWVLVLALLTGGILGNLHDRLWRPPAFGLGHVVDFISLPHFAIFNIADAAICLSMGAAVLLTFLGYRLDGYRELKAEAGKEEEG
ncbi:MAG: signal peptidase II [Rothia sp. (in: high G+C Gram-positive bacteria)]|nr:signal peptidase II [Rothia sp. (in: high G+C Gram-positive bacteria)]